jgi:hypothetical protein
MLIYLGNSIMCEWTEYSMYSKHSLILEIMENKQKNAHQNDVVYESYNEYKDTEMLNILIGK